MIEKRKHTHAMMASAEETRKTPDWNDMKLDRVVSTLCRSLMILGSKVKGQGHRVR